MQLSICLWAFSLQVSVETLHLLGPQIKLVISKNSKVFLSFCVPTLLSICAVHQTNLKILLHHYVISHLINLPVLWIFSPSLVQLYTIFLHILSIFTGNKLYHIILVIIEIILFYYYLNYLLIYYLNYFSNNWNLFNNCSQLYLQYLVFQKGISSNLS